MNKPTHHYSIRFGHFNIYRANGDGTYTKVGERMDEEEAREEVYRLNGWKYKPKTKKQMSEVWHTNEVPIIQRLVIVINSDNEIVDFGFYSQYILREGERWAYMNDLVKHTIKDKK